MSVINTEEDFDAFVWNFQKQSGYRPPLAFGIGIAHLSEAGEVIDTFYPFPNYRDNFGAATVMAKVVGHLAGTSSYRVSLEQCDEMLSYFVPFRKDGKRHGNIDAIESLGAIVDTYSRNYGNGRKTVVVSFIDQPEHDPGPQAVADGYLRLHLLSHRLVKPHQINLDGLFGKLPNNAWTNEGPVALEDLPNRTLETKARSQTLLVNSVDKFPRMVDYVVPSGVRIADGARVRLGAYLGKGTTVMHEGFVNFNAGVVTGEPSKNYEPRAMIEGRISAGVVVGDQTDIGGGFSIMGTLSGGGKEKIKIGRGCLLGANGGTGISLGDKCVIEAGLYVTAGMPLFYNGKEIKARDLSGRDGLTFRRNGLTGVVEVLDRPNNVELNEELHNN